MVGACLADLASTRAALTFLCTLVYNVSNASKTTRVSESLHEQITAHNREDETPNETLERLVSGPSLRKLAGTLSDDEAETFRSAIEASHRQHAKELAKQFDDTE